MVICGVAVLTVSGMTIDGLFRFNIGEGEMGSRIKFTDEFRALASRSEAMDLAVAPTGRSQNSSGPPTDAIKTFGSARFLSSITSLSPPIMVEFPAHLNLLDAPGSTRARVY
jgi:hypothetical protein